MIKLRYLKSILLLVLMVSIINSIFLNPIDRNTIIEDYLNQEYTFVSCEKINEHLGIAQVKRSKDGVFLKVLQFPYRKVLVGKVVELKEIKYKVSKSSIELRVCFF